MKELSIGLIFASLMLFPKFAFAWGGRGHSSICEAAVFLVKNPQLKEYLQNKPHMMGHLCNIPDVYWKNLSAEKRKLGDPAHYIDPEILGLPIKEIPTDYRAIIEKYTGTPSKFKQNTTIFSIPDELGSNWWRAEQLYKRAIAVGQNIKTLTPPKDSKEEQNDDFPYNKSFYDMIVNLGLMGHFIGDASQPFHSTSDYDGFAANHGGIHAYYEDACVAYFDADLIGRIVKKAKSFKNPIYIRHKNFIENMRAFSDLAASEIKDVLKLDPVIKPSIIKIEKGMSIKTPAERQPASVGFKKFEKLMLEEMARSSFLLAHLWDQAFVEAGEPSVKAYKSYRYPLTPDFIEPDYFDIKPAAAKK